MKTETQSPRATDATKHTPVPWQYATADYIDGTQYVIIGPDGLAVAKLPKVTNSNAEADLPEARATAAFIVAACNTHAANLAEIARLRVALNYVASFMDSANLLSPEVIAVVPEVEHIAESVHAALATPAHPTESAK